MSFLSRIKQARLGRVLIVYLGASWVVVEAADVFQSALALPDWVVPVTIILLLVGLVVVGATAWVQASPGTDAREVAGEVPSDWQLDLPDMARSVRRGRLPHPTWGRALAGGALAFLILFGFAGLYVLVTSDRVSLEPRSLVAGEAAPGLAVLPFHVSGGELEVWREGMVDLLSRNLDGLGGLRAIDSRTVLARWRETVRGGDTPDLATTLDAAGRTGARWALLGSAVTVGSRVRVSADLHDLETGRRIDGAATEGSPDSLLAMVDRLSVEVARSLLSLDDAELSGIRLSSITTESPEALRAFLAGEAAYRRSSFDPAIEGFQRAVDLDPAFALAHYRLASALGWTGRGGEGLVRAAAYENRDRLPAREARMVEAEYRARSGALPSGVALLREGVRQYPDQAEMWYQLGDIYLHWGPQLLVSPADAERALVRAVELDPGFAPYHIHVVDLALLKGDSAEAARRLAAQAAVAQAGSRGLEAHRLLFTYLYGSAAERDRVLTALDTVDARVLAWLVNVFSLEGEKVGDALTLGSAVCEKQLAEPGTQAGMRYICLNTMLANGRIDRVQHHAAAMRNDGERVIPAMLGVVMRQTGLDPSAPIGDAAAVLSLAAGTDGLISPGVFAGGMMAIEAGRPALADSAIRTIAGEAAARREAGDTLDARILDGLAQGLGGYRALAAGRAGPARRQLETAQDLLAGSVGPEGSFRTLLIWPLAELYAAEGRHEEALRLYESLWEGYHAGPAILRRADIHDQLGDADRAAQLRRQFLALWSGADPDHPLVRQTRSRLPPG